MFAALVPLWILRSSKLSQSTILSVSLTRISLCVLLSSRVKRICGTVISAEKKALAERLFSASRIVSSSHKTNAGPAIIDLHFHVIAANATIQGGYFPYVTSHGVCLCSVELCAQFKFILSSSARLRSMLR